MTEHVTTLRVKKQRSRCLQQYFWRKLLFTLNSYARLFFIGIGPVCCNVFAKYREVTGVCIIQQQHPYKLTATV